MPSSTQRRRWQRRWDAQARTYDRDMRWADRRLFGDTRAWVCSQARGTVLEVAIGTGLNLDHYPADVCLTGVELSAAMLELARDRSARLGRTVQLHHGDAEALELPEASFDTVVCTFSLCAIPDHRRALAEMTRGLRPGGALLLADHVAAGNAPLRGLQRLAETVTVPLAGEHQLRRPFEDLPSWGYRIERHERFKLGVVERLLARKPEP